MRPERGAEDERPEPADPGVPPETAAVPPDSPVGPPGSAVGPSGSRVPLAVIAREWGRIGVTGFGGPPAHIALLRRLCVQDRGWIAATEFEDAIAACNLLPGPASTQLAIWCGWRLRGRPGALVAGACFILPGLAVILALSALILGPHPPAVVLDAAAGAGAAVPAVALHAARQLAQASRQRIQREERTPGPTAAAAAAGGSSPPVPSAERGRRAARFRWLCYAAAGAAAAALIGPYLVGVLALCGLVEILVRATARRPASGVGAADSGSGSGPDPDSDSDSDSGDAAGPGHRLSSVPLVPLALPAVAAAGGLAALAWEAFKVGALSYGGGFVIIPLMQHDAVHTYHWMTNAQFLDAVALGQVTPGPVVLTTAVVGYAAAGYGGALMAAAIAFSPSFLFVLGGAGHFGTLRANRNVQAFLTGTGPAVIGAIAGSAVPLALALSHPWQYALLAAASLYLLVLRRGVVSALLLAAVCGALVAQLG